MLAGLLLALLYAANRRALPLDEIERSVDELVSQAQQIAAAASRESGLPIPELGPSPHSGPTVRLTDLLAEAEHRATGPSPAAVPGEGSRRLEFVRVDRFDEAPGGVAGPARGAELWGTASHLELDPTEVDRIELRLRHRAGRRFEIGWSRELLTEWDRRRLAAVAVDVQPGAAARTHVIPGSALRYRLRSGDRIARLLLRPSDVPDDEVVIESARVVSRSERYAAAPFGERDELRGDEYRPAIYLRGPGELRFAVRVPEREPRLGLGLARALSDRAPIISIALDERGERHVLHRSVLDGDEWRDATIALDAYRGRKVVLTLGVEGEGVALFAHPTLFGTPPEPFNVLLILEDTLRADRLGAWGHERPTSPARDALARRGVLFEYAFSQSTKTRPSVPSLMTSLYPTATGVWHFADRLHPSFVTLAELLSRQGFETGAFVQNPNAGPAAGLHQGFDHFFDSLVTGRRPQDVFSPQTVAWIEARRQRNLFLFLHVIDPHGVYDPPPPHDEWYRAWDGSGKPVQVNRRRHDPEWVETPTREGRRLLYDGEVRHNDERLGAFLTALERSGWLDDTLIVLLSDHGEHLGEHALWEHHPPSYIQVLHVPLILVHPVRLPAGVRVSSPVQMLDVMPTILELAGIDPMKLPLQGRSLLTRIEQPAAPGLAIAEEVTAYGGRDDPRIFGSFFRDEHHLLLGYQRLRHRVPGMRAYDYRSDPGEERPRLTALLDPLVRRRAERSLRRLREANFALWRAVTSEGEEATVLDPAVADQLRALGYIE